MKSTTHAKFKVFLPQSAHSQAQKFSDLQENSRKAQQVYLNILAIHAVNYYLNCLGFETEIMAGDSWNPVIQTLIDSADLVVKDQGKIECRPVLPNAEVCYIPAEVWSERIGYVAVQFNSELTEATLLGSVRTVKTESLPIKQFQPLEDLIGYLSQTDFNIVNLRQWFDEIFEFHWQILDKFIHADTQTWTPVRESYLSSGAGDRLEVEGKNPIAGAKLIDLGMQLGKQAVFLVITIIPEKEEKLGLQVQLYPLADNSYLPPHIELTLLSETGGTLANVASRLYDNFIQLPYFKGKVGESFRIKVALDNVSLVETFTF